MPKVPNTWHCFATHPPVLVRLLARRRLKGKHVEAMSTEDIAIASGIPLDRVIEISRSTTWDAVTIGEAERFILACRWDPTSPQDRHRYLSYKHRCKQKPTANWFSYLKKSPWWEREFAPLISILKRTRAKTKSPTASEPVGLEKAS